MKYVQFHHSYTEIYLKIYFRKVHLHLVFIDFLFQFTCVICMFTALFLSNILYVKVFSSIEILNIVCVCVCAYNGQIYRYIYIYFFFIYFFYIYFQKYKKYIKYI